MRPYSTSSCLFSECCVVSLLLDALSEQQEEEEMGGSMLEIGGEGFRALTTMPMHARRQLARAKRDRDRERMRGTSGKA